MEIIQFILYVKNQEESTDFYRKIFQLKPTLFVKGMTEFTLQKNVKLGLMPNNGIAKIVSLQLPHPNTGIGIPRCELYLKVKNAKLYMDRAISLGATLISELKLRDWGDEVGYIADSDGHIIAFTEE